MVALGAIEWGTWALFLRGHGLPPAWQSVMILCAVTLVWIAPAARDTRVRPRRPAAAWALLAACALTDAANYISYFGALDRGPIALAVLTHYLAPLVVAGLSPLMLREKLTVRTQVCLGVSLAGLALLVLGDGGLPRASAVTATAGSLSALFYGLNTLCTKKALDHFSAAELLAYHCIAAAAIVAPVAGPMPPLRAFVVSPLTGAVLIGGGGAALFYAGLSRVPASRAAVLTYLEPLVASFVGFLVFSEPLGPAGMAGGALILAGGAAVAVARD